MKIKAISLDSTPYYAISPKDQPVIKEIRTVYIFNPESSINLCELTPSYELRYLYTYIVFADDISDERRNELDEKYCYEDEGDDRYIHCADLDKKRFVDCGEYESWNEATEYLQGNCPI